jgi:hypothetical protein
MRHFVRHDIVDDLRRRESKPRREAQAAGAGAAAPLCGGVARSDARDLAVDARRLGMRQGRDSRAQFVRQPIVQPARQVLGAPRDMQGAVFEPHRAAPVGTVAHDMRRAEERDHRAIGKRHGRRLPERAAMDPRCLRVREAQRRLARHAWRRHQPYPAVAQIDAQRHAPRPGAALEHHDQWHAGMIDGDRLRRRQQRLRLGRDRRAPLRPGRARQQIAQRVEQGHRRLAREGKANGGGSWFGATCHIWIARDNVVVAHRQP